MSLKNPKEIHEFSEEANQFLSKILPERVGLFIQVGPKKYTDLKCYVDYKEKIHNFEVWKDDVWVVTLPRSGTTLTEELVWQVCNDLDFKTGFQVPLIERFPFFDYALHNDKTTIDKIRQNYCVNEQKLARFNKIFTPEWDKTHNPGTKRFFKTHWAFSMLPANFLTSGCKVVYVARNPKDEMVSRYHFNQSMGFAVPEKFEDFWTMLEMDLLAKLPYIEHVKEAWDLRHKKNILFLFYEDIVKDIPGTIKKVAKFFNKQFTDLQVDKLAKHLQIDNFRENKSVNEAYREFFPENGQLVRNGKIGSCREDFFTPELMERADKWMVKQLEESDLRFSNVD